MKYSKELVSAGYFITKFVERPDGFPKDLLPEKIVTLSPCIAEFLPDIWALFWVEMDMEERKEEAGNFGVGSDQISALMKWVSEKFGTRFGWPNVCLSLEAAHELYSKCGYKGQDALILGLGLHPSLSDEFMEETTPPGSEPGYASVGECGLHTAVKLNEPMKEGGIALGFEILCCEWNGVNHSWLCNHLETPFANTLNIRPNEYGLIDSFADAKKAADTINEGKISAEPGLWLPWLVVKYPLPAAVP